MDWISATGERDRLRQEFPEWCIFHDPYAKRWFAVHGRHEQVVADNPRELRRQLRGDGGQGARGRAEPEPEPPVSNVRELLDMMSRGG